MVGPALSARTPGFAVFPLPMYVIGRAEVGRGEGARELGAVAARIDIDALGDMPVLLAALTGRVIPVLLPPR
jgi:hypothetical protein